MPLPFVDVNLIAVLVAGAASMAIGMLWYSRLLFGRAWMSAMSRTPETTETKKKESMAAPLLVSFAGALLTAYILGVLLQSLYIVTALDAAFLGFLVWLGFVATATLTTAMFDFRSKTLFLINSGHQLAVLIASSVILALW